MVFGFRVLLSFFFIFIFFINVTTQAAPSFVKVNGNTFSRNGHQYNYIGANFWYAMNLGSKGPGGDRARLVREFDKLKSLGIRNLRILGGSEGPDTAPFRVSPALQKSPGVYDQDLLEGLDFALDEMRKRDLTAVIMLNNFWEWSGGMSQYRIWAGAGPVPMSFINGYIAYTSEFYSDVKAMTMFSNFVNQIVSRTNSISKIAYAKDPTIMAWELANEPRGALNTKAFNVWINSTAKQIKSLDAAHLVTTGVEGNFHDPYSGLDLIENHSSRYVDYATLHVWVQNNLKYDPLNAKKTYNGALTWVKNLLDEHVSLQHQLKKPLVIEEFGLARDESKFEPLTPVSYRDRFYAFLFEKVLKHATSDLSFAGINFWAWGGEGVAENPGAMWKIGNTLIGDPAHEPQGWYSVFSTDTTTLNVISTYAQKLNQIQ